METISWQHFEQVDLRVGTIVTAEVFAEARLPAYILHVDFGPDIGVLKSSAQITLTMLGGGNTGGGIQNDTTQQNNIEDSSQVSNDMDDEIPF